MVRKWTGRQECVGVRESTVVNEKSQKRCAGAMQVGYLLLLRKRWAGEGGC